MGFQHNAMRPRSEVGEGRAEGGKKSGGWGVGYQHNAMRPRSTAPPCEANTKAKPRPSHENKPMVPSKPGCHAHGSIQAMGPRPGHENTPMGPSEP